MHTQVGFSWRQWKKGYEDTIKVGKENEAIDMFKLHIANSKFLLLSFLTILKIYFLSKV